MLPGQRMHSKPRKVKQAGMLVGQELLFPPQIRPNTPLQVYFFSFLFYFFHLIIFFIIIILTNKLINFL